MGRFKVVEKFISINGEGRCAGELAAFIRFAGCNLNCSYCDTRWANEPKVPYEILSEEEIYAYIKGNDVNNVTLTGGEPLLQENIGRLIKMLSKDKSLRIEIETNGAVSLKDYIDIGENVTFTLDYKLPGSKMNHKMIMDNYDLIRACDTVKFVVSDQEDLDKAREVIKQYQLTDRVAVYLSSSFGVIKPEDIVNYMMEHKLNKVRLQLQMHKYIWDPDKKGV
ncbi:MAG: putative 7-carboxy-7-deazaguanine synthase QueE [Lachnospiraceae bacterium]|nr:putative 7-carboxy-7-deazaguanine synthase QueE [Lachnospiraceae bacterium]